MTPEKGIILVAGSNGLIGQAVMRRFAGRFTDVVGFDRKAPAPPPPGCVHVAVEITSDESVREGLRAIRAHYGERIASVIHLAEGRGPRARGGHQAIPRGTFGISRVGGAGDAWWLAWDGGCAQAAVRHNTLSRERHHSGVRERVSGPDDREERTMISHRHWVVAAALVLTSACSARSGTSGPMMMGGMAHGGMAHGGMAHDMATMPSLASMMQRADSLVRRTERMMRATADTTPHAMAMEQAVGDSSQMAAGSLHTMAIGLRGLLQHMDAMHRSGMKMEGNAGTAMMELHQSANGMLGEMEKTLQALDRMQAHHAKDRP